MTTIEKMQEIIDELSAIVDSKCTSLDYFMKKAVQEQEQTEALIAELRQEILALVKERDRRRGADV